MKCGICGSDLKVCKSNDDYHECVSCKTQVLIDRESFSADFYEDTYLNETDENLKKGLITNYNHYFNLYNNIQCSEMV